LNAANQSGNLGHPVTPNMKTKAGLLITLALALALPAAILLTARAAVAGRAAAPARPQGPCDIYAAGGTPCVAAHSTTRALSASYNGPLYQVRRESDGKTLDIGLAAPAAPDTGGYADAAAQDAFCADTLCVITRIYDQSGKGNDLLQAPPGTFLGPAKGGFDTLPIADMAPISIGGHKAYGVFIMPGMGFRNNNATDLAINDEPEGIYYVIDGTHYDSGCCFDYGNASTNGRAVGTGTMETTYFGTATAWGSGAGPGPWIMSDMEAGLFSGYGAKQNSGSPTIDSWRFVTAVVDGGGGNQWDLRGGNAQQGGLTTFYSGPRPGTPDSNAYFPMHKKGGVLLGNGGDNGNGSSGTFYEGVMTAGYPTEATTDAVQANIVAAKYDVPQVKLSPLITLLFSSKPLVSAAFTPGSTQDLTVSFTNTTGEAVTGVKLSLALPAGWTDVVSGTTAAAKTFTNSVAPGTNVIANFKVTSPAATSAGYLTGKAEWAGARSETATLRVRSVPPVKLNEVLLGSGTSQFIELYNAGSTEVDISNWSLVSTASQWASVKLATIPTGTKLAAGSYYLLGLASSGLAAPAGPSDTTINVRSATGYEAGQEITIDGETRKLAAVGTPASAPTTVFIPVSTGPWLTIPAGSTNLPVTSAAGFEVGQKIGIDLGGNHEIATVTAVGKSATQTTLAVAAAKGASSLTIAGVGNLSVGDTLTVDTGRRKELVTVKSVAASAPAGGAAPAGARGGGRGGRGGGGVQGTVELTTPLQLDHASSIDVSSPGTGISFTPATKFAHTSGDAVQALGTGLTLDRPLTNAHPHGAPVLNPQAAAGYQGPPAPNQWFGSALATSIGSLALMDASGTVVVDAIVYGEQQSSSSARGTITSPELATLEGDQGKGGNIVVVPAAPRGGRGRGVPAATPGAAPTPSRSLARITDGADTDNLGADFQLQPPTPGAPNQLAQ
jgi:hypothetical protein